MRYSWDRPNPRFLPQLAGSIDPGIYRASAYLKQFHAKYADKAALDEKAKQQKLKSWAALHNRVDDMKEQTNPALPTLMAWRVMNAAPANRFVFERNPYYHRIDKQGQQLPYVDRIVMDVSASGLFAAKANAGEVDLLFRGLSMSDIPVLKEGEKAKGYRTLLWPYARGTELALYPSLNTVDPVWRELNRDLRFRRALSLGIDRKTLNNALLFGLGTEGNNTIVSESPLFSAELRTANAGYDPAEASRLLDEIGLTKRNGAGIRLLPDGRELEIIVETDGESSLVVDGLTLIGEFWREIGVRLFVKPQDRTVLRNRSYAGPDDHGRGARSRQCDPHRHHAADGTRPHAPGQLRLAEMGPVCGDQGQERRSGRHPGGQAAARSLHDLDEHREPGGAAGCLARDAAQPCREPMVHRHHLRRAAADRGPQRVAGPSRQSALQLGAHGDDRHLPVG